MTFKELTESINDKGLLKAVFMVAGPGSGKTFIGKHLFGQIQPKIINTDTYSRDYFGITKQAWDIFSTETPSSIVDKSKNLTKEQLFQNINSMLPLMIDSTSSNSSSLFKRDGILKSFGYETAMVFVKVSLETAIRRNQERLTNGKGGVSEEFLKATYNKIQEIENYYKENFKNFYVIINEDDNAFDINLNKQFKKIQNYYNISTKNPIGQNILNELKDKSGKYLSDTDEFSPEKIRKIIDGWY